MEDFLVNLVVLGFAAGGLWLLYLGLNAWKVLLLSSLWPQVTARVRGRVETRVQQRQVRSDYIPSGEDEVTRDGWGDTKVTSRSHTPVLNLTYTWRGRPLQGDNRAFWNHRGGYTSGEARACVEKACTSPLTIRLNPARPQEIFLGAAHFPWIVSVLWILIGGPVATGGIGSLLRDLAKWAHYQEPLILGDRSSFILAVPILSLLWLGAETLMSLLAPRSAQAPDSPSPAGD